jgi:3-phosphoshikimate 1-carboxyvinyltransferase
MAAVHDLIVAPQARPLEGSVPIPSDPRIAELAILCAALAEGKSEIRWLSQGRDVETMIGALRSLGVDIEADERRARVGGVGLSGLVPADAAIDCGGAPSVLAALSGVLAASPFATMLDSRDVPRGLDLAELAGALRGRSGQIEGRFSATRAGQITLPLVVGPLPPRVRLSEVDRELAGSQPEIKSALLLSGLFAEGPTYLHERVMSPDHVVRLLDALDVPIATAGSAIELDPAIWPGKLPSFSYRVAGDLSAAMFFLTAASLVEDSRVCIRDVGLNPTRTGGIDVLRTMGIEVDVEVHGVEHGEPRGNVCAAFAPLRNTTLAGETLGRARGDLAVLVALAARARGTSEIMLEPALGDREQLARFAEVLGQFGVVAESTESQVMIVGRSEHALPAAEIEASDSAEVAVLATLLALLGDGESKIRGVDALAGRFPRLIGTLRALGANARIERRAE